MFRSSDRGLRTAMLVVAAGLLLAVPTYVVAGGGAIHLKTKMTGDQVVPQGDGAPEGHGKGTFTVRVDKRKLCYDLSWRKTSGAVTGYIFKGAKGENSPNPDHSIVILLTSRSPHPRGCETGLAKEKLEKIVGQPRKYHVVLINGTYTEGAIRGQLKLDELVPNQREVTGTEPGSRHHASTAGHGPYPASVLRWPPPGMTSIGMPSGSYRVRALRAVGVARVRADEPGRAGDACDGRGVKRRRDELGDLGDACAGARRRDEEDSFGEAATGARGEVKPGHRPERMACDDQALRPEALDLSQKHAEPRLEPSARPDRADRGTRRRRLVRAAGVQSHDLPVVRPRTTEAVDDQNVLVHARGLWPLRANARGMETKAKRTLVKSAPELWELADDLARMEAWMGGFVGSVRAGLDRGHVSAFPSSRLQLVQRGAAGGAGFDVALAESGFGTSVEITAQHESASHGAERRAGEASR